MITFVVAYLIVWLAVVLYLARLEVQQRRLARTVDALRKQWKPSEEARDAEQQFSKAA